jgi:hypothetical protein
MQNEDKFGRRSNDVTYESFETAIEAVKDAREYQMKAWPNTALENAGGRPFEEWALMLNHYVTKLNAVYTETPGNTAVTPTTLGDADGGEEYVPNVEGRKRIKKYAAIVANLAIWAIQSAMDGAGDND